MDATPELIWQWGQAHEIAAEIDMSVGTDMHVFSVTQDGLHMFSTKDIRELVGWLRGYSAAQKSSNVIKGGSIMPFQTIDSRPIRFKDACGVIHMCEGDDIHRGVRLIWTLCGRDVSANSAYLADDEVTCEKCKAVYAACPTI